MTGPDQHVVDFPTLGFLVADWIEAHCIIPDGFRVGEPFLLTGWQLWFIVNHYRVKSTATVGQLASAFYYRRSQIILPQKAGKGPFCAADCLAQACGPVLFCGWATGGEVYDCRDHGCNCGFVYEYAVGEPMGMAWPTPLIQVTAFSEKQAGNIWDGLQVMARGHGDTVGPLAHMLKVGQEFIRVGEHGRIDKVTSSAKSKLGARVTAVYQDETGVWTKSAGMIDVADTQNRGVAAMGGRGIETTNAYDPAEGSVAQSTYESSVKDIFRLFPQAPVGLSFGNAEHRRKILRHVYADVPWVDLDDIEGLTLELMDRDKAQAERFFGNRLVATADAWWDEQQIAAWMAIGTPTEVPAGSRITFGFDGSMYDDHTVIRARAWLPDGSLYGFTPTFSDGKRFHWNPMEHDGEVPRHEVQAAIKQLFGQYDVALAYFDPEYWQSEIDGWMAQYGEKRVVAWPTNRPKQMALALERLMVDTAQAGYNHDADEPMLLHLRNARRMRRASGHLVIGKPTQAQKIDLVIADTLAHEAAALSPPPRKRGMIVWR